MLAQPGIEGDPLAFLDVSEAYWRALRNQKHEPQKKGPKVGPPDPRASLLSYARLTRASKPALRL